MASNPEIFLQEYEKPTEAYRYIRARNMCAPIYLYRNLTYMRHRSTRTNKARSFFKVDSLLETIQNTRPDHMGDHLTLMFLGYFDKTIISHPHCVKLTTYVSKNLRRKRHGQAVPIGTSELQLQINPEEAAHKIPALSVPVNDFKVVDGPKGTFNKLVIRVRVDSNIMAINRLKKDEGPANKRRRTNDDMAYECDLAIFDKQGRCLLFDGEYEIPLRNSLNSMSFSTKTKQEKKRDEIIALNRLTYDTFQNLPILKFRIAWTKELYTAYVDWPLPKLEDPTCMGNDDGDVLEYDNTNVSGVWYHFIYDNNTRLQKQECNSFTCPWCKLNCSFLRPLVMHLILCHGRFSFTYVPSSETMLQIEVRINEAYDGSYTGSPHDSKILEYSNILNREKTIIIVSRHKKPSLSDFNRIEYAKISQPSIVKQENRCLSRSLSNIF